MDINVCRLIMQTLGRFHALSFVIKDQSPQLFQKLSSVLEETYYANRLKPWYNDFMNNQIEVALDAVKKIYGGTVVEERAQKFLTDGSLYDKMAKFTHARNRYSVIGHGDCWVPNFLIHSTKLDGLEIPVKAKMIDFQLARFASPVIDISFFIYSCTTEELRAQHYDDLIKTYHNSLSQLITDFGSNPEYLFPFSALEVSNFTLSRFCLSKRLNRCYFQSELKTSFRFGVGMGIESLPFIMMEENETADMDSIGDEAVTISSVWKLKNLEKREDLQRLADIFKHASDRGYLD